MNDERRAAFIERAGQLQAALTSAVTLLRNPDFQELFSRDYQFRETGDTFEILVVDPETNHHYIFAKHRGGAFPADRIHPTFYPFEKYEVKCDLENNTPTTIEQGLLRADILLKVDLEPSAHATLEYHGKLWGVERNEGETDNEYRERLIKSILETGRLPDMTFVTDPDPEC